MKILGIETSTMLGGAAVMDNAAGLLAEVRLNVKSTHSERLMTEIDHVLRQSQLDISDMDAFAVSIGPGSFTGLRIGLSTVKGLSYATGKPVISVPTLEAFAWNFPFCRHPLCLLLDARKKEVYAAVFTWEGQGFLKIIPESSLSISDLIKHDIFLNSKVVFAGEGSLIYKKEIISSLGENAVFAPAEKMVPSPANVAAMGLKKAQAGDFSEPVKLAPVYIRKSEAELKRNE